MSTRKSPFARTAWILAVVVLALHVAAAPTSAVIYDAAADFDASLAPPGAGGTNPNGVWTYGETAGLLGALVPFPDLVEPAAGVNCSAENMWLDLSTHVGFAPSVAKSIAACFDGNVAFDAGQLILHGGAPDRYAHVVFAAPSDLECTVAATFTARQNGVSADVHVLSDGAAIFSDVLVGGPGTLKTHNAVLTLVAGDTVSFAVGLGTPPQGLHAGNVELQAVIDCVATVATVAIDIKPGSFPNSINPKGKGTIPVAILSTPDFDATTEVDKTSLTFGKTGGEHSLAFCTKSDEDVNFDGLPDIVCHFHTSLTGFQVGDIEGILTGKTVGGVPIEGRDSVRIKK